MTSNLIHLSLDQVEQQFRYGTINYEQVRDYLRAWNAGPHLTQAVLADGAIRNFDPAARGRPYSQLWDEFGVRAESDAIEHDWLVEMVGEQDAAYFEAAGIDDIGNK